MFHEKLRYPILRVLSSLDQRMSVIGHEDDCSCRERFYENEDYKTNGQKAPPVSVTNTLQDVLGGFTEEL